MVLPPVGPRLAPFPRQTPGAELWSPYGPRYGPHYGPRYSPRYGPGPGGPPVGPHAGALPGALPRGPLPGPSRGGPPGGSPAPPPGGPLPGAFRGAITAAPPAPGRSGVGGGGRVESAGSSQVTTCTGNCARGWGAQPRRPWVADGPPFRKRPWRTSAGPLPSRLVRRLPSWGRRRLADALGRSRVNVSCCKAVIKMDMYVLVRLPCRAGAEVRPDMLGGYYNAALVAPSNPLPLPAMDASTPWWPIAPPWGRPSGPHATLIGGS